MEKSPARYSISASDSRRFFPMNRPPFKSAPVTTCPWATTNSTAPTDASSATSTKKTSSANAGSSTGLSPTASAGATDRNLAIWTAASKRRSHFLRHTRPPFQRARKFQYSQLDVNHRAEQGDALPPTSSFPFRLLREDSASSAVKIRPPKTHRHHPLSSPHAFLTSQFQILNSQLLSSFIQINILKHRLHRPRRQTKLRQPPMQPLRHLIPPPALPHKRIPHLHLFLTRLPSIFQSPFEQLLITPAFQRLGLQRRI